MALLKDGFAQPSTPLFGLDCPREPISFRQPLLVILQMVFKLLKRLEVNAEYECIPSIEDILAMAKGPAVMEQLGNNPMHYLNLMEDTIEAEKSVSGLEKSALLTSELAIRFLCETQDKKAMQLFIDKVYPAMGEFCARRSFDGLEAVKELLKPVLLGKDTPSEVEGILSKLVAVGQYRDLPSTVAKLKSWKPENNSFASQLVSKLLSSNSAKLSYAVFCVFAEGAKPSDSRTFLFNLFLLLGGDDLELTSVLLRVLASQEVYQHRNDDLYQAQTRLLKELITVTRGSAFELVVLESVLKMNYYVVQEAFDQITVSVSTFLSAYIEASVEARQLPQVIEKLFQCKDFSVSHLTFPSFSAPVMAEVCKILLSQATESPLTVFALAKQLCVSSLHVSGLTLLVQKCFAEGLFTFAPDFLVAMFNKLPMLRLEFKGLTTGLTIVDMMLNGPDGASSDIDAQARLLPLAREDGGALMRHILDKLLVQQDPRYTPLVRVASFYEIPYVRQWLLKCLANEFSGNSVLPQFVAVLPSELFAEQPVESIKLAQIVAPLSSKALAAIAKHPQVAIPLECLEISLLSMLDYDIPSLESLIASCLNRYGYQPVIELLSRLQLQTCLVLGPLYSQSRIELAKDLAEFKSFTSKVLDNILTELKCSSSLDLIESIANAAAKLEWPDTISRVFETASIVLKSLNPQDIPLKLLLICIKTQPETSSDSMNYLAICMMNDSKDVPANTQGKAAQAIFERQSLEEYKSTLKTLVSITDLKLCQVAAVYLKRSLNLAGPVKQRLAFEASIKILHVWTGLTSLAFRLVISKSIRPLKSQEVGKILSLCVREFSNDPEATLKTLAALQDSYWHLLRPMLPSYVGVLTVLLEQLMSHGTSSHIVQFGRLLTDMSSISVPGSGGLAYALPPLILAFVKAMIKDPVTASPLQLPFFALFKHLESRPSSSKDEKARKIDHMARLVRICNNFADERTVLMRLFEDYRKDFKYQGKA